MLLSKKKMLVSILLLSCVSLANYAAPAEKIRLCHNSKIISVSGNSLNAHRNHGDGIVGIDVGEDCLPLPPVVPPPCDPFSPTCS